MSSNLDTNKVAPVTIVVDTPKPAEADSAQKLSPKSSNAVIEVVVDIEKGKKDDIEGENEKKPMALETEAAPTQAKKPFTWKGYWEETFVKDKWFWLIIVVLLLANIGVHRFTPVGIWFGFLLSSYAAIANDSIQTLGTFIASNTGIVAWWKQWIWIALIFNGTTIYSWAMYGGDITHERL